MINNSVNNNYVCVCGIEFPRVHDFTSIFCNCFDGVIFLVCSFYYIKYHIQKTCKSNCEIS